MGFIDFNAPNPSEQDKEIRDYETGIMDLSIGTDLAFETLTSNEDASVKPVQFDELWINIRTLIRNTSSAMRKELRTEQNILDNVLSDIEILSNTDDAWGSSRKIVLYNTTAKYVKTMVPYGDVKIPNTVKQKAARDLEYGVLNRIKELKVPMVESDTKFGNPAAKALLITHLPTDLLSRYGFADVSLLESHTGVIKTFPEWTTKILTTANRKYASNLPFNKLTLTVMGDGNRELQAKPRVLVAAYLALAVDNNWKATTSQEKIRTNIRNLRDRALSQELLKILF